MIYYVNSCAKKDGDGTKICPFKNINDAAKVAVAGDEIIVAPGIYREYVDPINGGTENERIIYRSEKPLGAVITGAESIKNWKRYDGNVWTVRVDNSIFGDYNPYTTEVYGDWFFGNNIFHTGAVYLNDKMMYETKTLDECIEGKIYSPSWNPEFSIYKWYSEQDNNETVIFANFHGKNPNEENVEINVRRRCFFPSKTGVGYITFSGFNVNKAATTWAPPAAFQDGMIGPHWSKGWIIEDCDISNSKCCGISLGRYYDPENNNYFSTKQIKSPTQMERDSVCRGQYHGWTKETIGSHIIRRNNIHDCEQTGIVGRMGGVFSLIEDNHIHHINNMQQLIGAEIAGIKLHAAIDVVIRRNHIHNCLMGIWCDWEAQGTRITQNLLHDNNRPDYAEWIEGCMYSVDLFVEVSHGPTIIDNNILMSKGSIQFATEGVAVVHNLILGSFTFVGSGTGTRYTPYHIRHRTEVAGFSTINHGDNRFYNNIFVQKYPPVFEPKKGGPFGPEQKIGTWTFVNYPTYEEWISHFDFSNKHPDMDALQKYHEGRLPVWVEGNAYFNGAAYRTEDEIKLYDNKNDVYIDLVEKEGKCYISTNLYEFLNGFTNRIITSDILGMAFHPEQRFENPDGSEIIFNKDYFGNNRLDNVIPGPFASSSELNENLSLMNW